MTSQSTCVSTACLVTCSCLQQRKRQRSASLAPYERQITPETFPYDVIMNNCLHILDLVLTDNENVVNEIENESPRDARKGHQCEIRLAFQHYAILDSEAVTQT